MKAIILALALVTAGTLAAQETKPADHSATTVLPPFRATVVMQNGKMNEVIGSRFIYTGIAVQMVKAQNPLQLVNPMAPAEYGTGDCNMDRDIITGKPTGFKIFSIKF
jgi:hypothetical protein